MNVQDLYDSGKRYQARRNVENADKNADNDYEKGALSSGTPKPNVVRIEVLPASVRREYLGSFYSVFDRTRAAVANMHGKDTYLPFFGIMKSAGDPSFKIDAKWEKTKAGGFTGALQLLRQTASPFTNTLNAVGLGGVTSAVNGAVGGVVDKVENVKASALNLAAQAGIMSDGVGTSTLKSFNSANVELDYDIQVQWYMPEQEIPAMVGIERLIKMTYLRGTGKGIGSTVQDLMKNVTSEASSMLGGGNSDSTIKNGLAAVANAANSAVSSEAANKVTDIIDTVSDPNLWGTHYTTAPLPVRLCIGHTIDVQPMVITYVNFTTSTEQFLSTICGAHLPVTVTAQIKLTPWMIPSPDQQYFSFLGHEMFGSWEKK
jgi:hypothetical protein